MAEEGEKITLKPYDKIKSDNDFYRPVRDFCEGDDAVLNQRYIFCYRSEQPLSKLKEAPHISERIERTPYDDLINPVITKHSSALAQQIKVEGIDEEDELIVNVDGSGTRLDKFRNESAEEFLKVGRVCFVAEAPAQQFETEEEARAANQRPYLKRIDAEKLYRWTYFSEGPDVGKLAELMFLEKVEVNPNDMTKKLYHWRRYLRMATGNYMVQLLTSETNETSKDHGVIEFTVKNELQGAFPEIPARVFGEAKKSSLLNGIWQRAKHVLNMRSLHVDLMYKQNFRVVYVKGIRSAEVEENLKVLSHSNIVVLPGEATMDTVEPGTAKEIDDYVKGREEALTKAADMRLLQLTVSDTRQVQSAESKEKDEKPKIHVYNEILDLLRDELTAMYRFMARFNNVNVTDEQLKAIKIDSAREFGLEDNETDLLWLDRVVDTLERFDDDTQLKGFKVLFKLQIGPIEQEDIQNELAEIIETATLKRPQLTSFGFPPTVDDEDEAEADAA